eukprot:IDg5148t1
MRGARRCDVAYAASGARVTSSEPSGASRETSSSAANAAAVAAPEQPRRCLETARRERRTRPATHMESMASPGNLPQTRTASSTPSSRAAKAVREHERMTVQ